MPPTLSLEATAFNQAQLVHLAAPQVALAGRSNVGKSSLINALAGRKQLAKTSATPGKTRSINYYAISPLLGYLVDLPGYGYARCSQEERKKWEALLEIYLTQTPGLRALALLIDSRLPPQKLDIQLLGMATAHNLPLLPVLTKTDKCSRREVDQCKHAWAAMIDPERLIETSASKKTGVDALWVALLQALTPEAGTPLLEPVA